MDHPILPWLMQETQHTIKMISPPISTSTGEPDFLPSIIPSPIQQILHIYLHKNTSIKKYSKTSPPCKGSLIKGAHMNQYIEAVFHFSRQYPYPADCPACTAKRNPTERTGRKAKMRWLGGSGTKGNATTTLDHWKGN